MLRFQLHRAGQRRGGVSVVQDCAECHVNIRDRIDGDLTLGYNYTKASDVAQLNVGLDLAYRDEVRIVSADLDAASSTSANNESSERINLSFNYIRLLRNRWVAGAIGSAERNDELGIDRRFSFGGGGGRFPRPLPPAASRDQWSRLCKGVTRRR